MINFRTDLASERRDIFKKANNIENEIQGIESEKEEINENLKIERVKITTEEGEKAIGKPKGNYITIDVNNLKIAQEDEISKASEVLANELKKIVDLHTDKQGSTLVVGLGNIYVTPDSLGPKVINEIEVTRHVIKYLPQYVEEGTREISAISPGVLGTTGIETQEILTGIIEKVKPKLVIVIDALASRSIERISSTIQLADTGIVPGAGVGNKRKELTKQTLGIPVIAIGIPTVVEAATIAADSLDLVFQKMQEEAEKTATDGEKLYTIFKEITEEDKYNMIKEVLLPKDYNFIVTPKEIDELIKTMSSIVARGINASL